MVMSSSRLLRMSARQPRIDTSQPSVYLRVNLWLTTARRWGASEVPYDAVVGKQKRRELTEAWEAFLVADETLDHVDAIRRVREAAEDAELDAVRTARAQGISWSRIGALYGLTKQGAQQRFRLKG